MRPISESIDRAGAAGLEGVSGSFGLERQRTTMAVISERVLVGGIGMAVGVAIGMLFAPMAGSELRETIAKRGREIVKRGAAVFRRDVSGKATPPEATPPKADARDVYSRESQRAVVARKAKEQRHERPHGPNGPVRG